MTFVGAAALAALSSCRTTPTAPAPATRATATATATANATGGGSSSATAPSVTPVPMPGASNGAGFDDLGFAPSLHKVLAPAGGSGKLDLVDPATRAVTSIGGFSAASAPYGGGHGEGTTSADEGPGVVFAIDRTTKTLAVVDAKTLEVTSRASLAADPDYVRWVAPTSEVWVTEPDAEQIEVFAWRAGTPPSPSRVVRVAGGPESLVVDAERKVAFTHLWKGTTVAIDLATHAIRATMPNGCEGSRGIALDRQRDLLFVGCAEGKAVAIDPWHGGAVVGTAEVGAGVDVIAYAPSLHHLYVPGSKTATMAIISVAPDGKLTVVATVPTRAGAHCVAADDARQAWVCDPRAGRLLLVKDAY